MALDEAVQPIYNYVGQYSSEGCGEGLGFPGYAYLAELTQRSEYRRPSEIIAKEMTRKWMRLVSTGDDGNAKTNHLKALKQQYRDADPVDAETLRMIQEEWASVLQEEDTTDPDKAQKLEAISAELKRLGVQDLFRRAQEQDGWFGRSHLWLETCDPDDRTELLAPLRLDAQKIGRGGLKSLRLVEAMWTYPGQYDATNPLRADYFNPSTWYVMGTEVHASRLLTFVSRPMPDILKPAYQFGGLSLSQMLKPYVDNWLRTRQSVSDGISNFSIMILLTDLSKTLAEGGLDAVLTRAEAFNRFRSNNGLMLGDKESEDLKNVSMPLSSLDHLQAQSQEHMSSVTGIPLVKYFGITPSGLNASSDGEVKCFYDWISSLQESDFTPPITTILKAVQLSLFGEIDPTIDCIWEPLWSLNELELATARKTEMDTHCAAIDHGVIDAQEVRAVLAGEEDSPYAGLDLNKEMDATGDDGGKPEDDVSSSGELLR